MTGWANPPLNARGIDESRSVGHIMRRRGVVVTHALASRSDRALLTTRIILRILDNPLDVSASWRLNERHLGALQGLDRSAATLVYGRENLRQWKYRLDAVPPMISFDDPRHPHHDPRYGDVDPRWLPGGESLIAMGNRLIESWRDEIEPLVVGGSIILVVGHCHSLRALAALLDGPNPHATTLFASPTDSITFSRTGNNWSRLP